MKNIILFTLLAFYSSISFSQPCHKYTMLPVEITLKKGKPLIGFVEDTYYYPDSPFVFHDTEVLIHKNIFKIVPPFCLGNSKCPSNLRHIVSNNKTTKRIWVNNIKGVKPHKRNPKMSAYSDINKLPYKTIELLSKEMTPLKIISFESVSTDKFLIISYNAAYSDAMLEKIKKKVMQEVFLPNKYGKATIQSKGAFFKYNEIYKNKDIVFYNSVTDCTIKNPNKAIKPFATLSGTFKSGVSLAFKSPLS